MHGLLKVMMVVAGLVTLSGCMSPMQRKITEEGSTAAEFAADVRKNAMARPEAVFRTVDGVYLGRGEPLPIVPDDGRDKVLDAEISIERGVPVTLELVAELIEASHDVPVRVTGDAIAAAARTAPDPLDAGSVGAGVATQTAGAFRVAYRGSLRGLLDWLASRTGNYWEWQDDGVVVIAHFLTKTYRVAAVPGQTSLSDTLGSASGGSGGAGGAGGGSGGGAGGAGGGAQATASNETSMTAEVNVIAPVAEAVQGMLSDGGRVSLTEGLGIVTVTDVPTVHARVKQYIDSVNAVVLRQAVIDVQVVSVELNDAESYGLDWNIVRESLGAFSESRIAAFGQAAADVNSASFAIIDPTHNYGGSSVILSALATQGTVRVQTNAAVPTLSNHPVPISIVDETSYLASIQSNVVAESGVVQIQITPGVVTTGFSMSMLPVILANDDVLIQFGLSLASLRQLRTVSAGGGAAAGPNQIEVPTVARRNTLQRVKLKSGQTLALWGFDSSSDRTEGRGVGRPDFMLAGGSTNSARQRSVLVILVTPRVLD